MTQMPPDSLINEPSFEKVREHIYRDKLMVSPVDAARLIQTYLVAENDRLDSEKEKENARTRNWIRNSVKKTLKKRTKKPKAKSTKLQRPKHRR